MMKVFGGRDQYKEADRWEVEEQIAVWEAEMQALRDDRAEQAEQTQS